MRSIPDRGSGTNMINSLIYTIGAKYKYLAVQIRKGLLDIVQYSTITGPTLLIPS